MSQRSWGELIDKITILEMERLSAEQARANAAKELALLREIAKPALASGKNVQALAARLKGVNQAL
jgi:hypothetical protein